MQSIMVMVNATNATLEMHMLCTLIKFVAHALSLDFVKVATSKHTHMACPSHMALVDEILAIILTLDVGRSVNNASSIKLETLKLLCNVAEMQGRSGRFATTTNGWIRSGQIHFHLKRYKQPYLVHPF